jgi:PAS domain S-box-containing protein
MSNEETTADVGDSGDPAAILGLIEEHATDLLCLNDPDGRPMWASRSLERLLGPTATLLENVHPGDREAVTGWWNQVNAGSSDRLRWRIRSAAGPWRWLETSAAVLRYRERPYVLCSARDITGQKRAEDALHESEQLIRAAARQARLAYWDDDFVANRVRWCEWGPSS